MGNQYSTPTCPMLHFTFPRQVQDQDFVADFIALDTPPCDSNLQMASRSFSLSVNWNRNQLPTWATIERLLFN